MGYSEVLCHICGVSFNISRLRTAEEGRKAAWANTGDAVFPFVEVFYVRDLVCSQGSGCVLVQRPDPNDDPPFVQRPHTGYSSEWETEGEDDDEARRAAIEAYNSDDYDSDDDSDDDDSDDESDAWIDSEDEEQAWDNMDDDSPEARREIEKLLKKADRLARVAKKKKKNRKASEKKMGIRRTVEDDPSASNNRNRDSEQQKAESDAQAKGQDAEDDEGNGSSDEDYKPPPDEQDDNPYEWDSEYESDGESSDDSDASETASEILYSSFKTDLQGGPLADTAFDEFVYFDAENADRSIFVPKDVLEHVAGPQCKAINAYNGHNISAEAMRGCNTWQCLARKSKDWEPEADDENFEKTGNFFLTGLSDHMPSRDGAYTETFPTRHGCGSPYAENAIWEADEAMGYAMPFHPTCFEIYKRASMQRNGKIDVEGLADWWTLEATFDRFFDFPRHTAVEESKSQWWEHRDGQEFLAANPCFVPGLNELLSKTQHTGASIEDKHRLVFPSVTETATPGDPFSRLPNEIRTMIVLHLASADIDALRLSSRAFRQLPQWVFRELTMRKGPWLYEVFDDMPFSFWATTTAKELIDEEGKWTEKYNQLNEARAKIRDDFDNDEEAQAQPTLEIIAQSLHDINVRRVACTRGLNHPVPAFSLSADNINWYNLYKAIALNMHKLPGLRNRKRIWKDCNEILDRIERYRANGRIVPGKPADPVQTAKEIEMLQNSRRRRDDSFSDDGNMAFLLAHAVEFGDVSDDLD